MYQAECKTHIAIEVDGCCEVLEIDLEYILQFCQTIKSTTYIPHLPNNPRVTNKNVPNISDSFGVKNVKTVPRFTTLGPTEIPAI